MAYDIEIICDKPTRVGEGPLWDAATNRLYYIDIHTNLIRSLDWETGKTVDTILPQQVGCIVQTTNNELVAALEDGIYFVGENGAIRSVCPETKFEGCQFNDGKVGPNGCFYVGTKDKVNSLGAFYKIGSDAVPHKLFGNVGISNGLGWSPDCRTLYYCDSPRKTLEAFTFDPKTGDVSDRRTICRVPFEEGIFDGLTVDAAGNIWAAIWGSSCIVKINPHTGELLETIRFPVSQVSCCAFAGENLDELIVTSASFQTDPEVEPYAGYLFRIKVDTPGGPVWKFKI